MNFCFKRRKSYVHYKSWKNGDEDGSTFIMKEDFITIDEMFEQFPKWKEAWQNCNNEEYDGKYIYVYMGFGKGIFVDKSIY